MQPLPAWKSDYTFAPLEEPEAYPDAPESPAGASAASNPNMAMLVERFSEPLGGGSSRAPAAARPVPAPRPSVAPPKQDTIPVRQANEWERMPAPARLALPVLKSLRLPIDGLVPGLAGLAVVSMSFLFFLWWQDTEQPPQEAAVQDLSVAGAAASRVQPEQVARASDVALSAPDRVEADAGEAVAFPIAIDAAAELPPRSLVAVSALPQGASFSQGRPYGDTGWSLRPDEIAGLELSLPRQIGAADMRLELIAGDGTVLAQSTTQLSITPPPVATVGPVESAPAEETAPAEATAGASAPAEQGTPAETTGSAAALTPTPQRKPSSEAANEPDVKVNTVKTVTIDPPRDARPYDGGYGLGQAADEPEVPGEWMETKTAVDMHAEAKQSSETVKIAQGGIKMRVTGRDKNWIEVHDPASSTTGWIYNRFLKPADPPAQ